MKTGRSYVSVPTWVYTLTLLLFHGYIGLGALNTPESAERDSLAFKLASIHQWGALFLIGALFTMVAAVTQDKLAAVANVVAALPFTVFAVSVFATEIQTSQFGAAALFVIPILLHAVMAWHSWTRRGRDTTTKLEDMES